MSVVEFPPQEHPDYIYVCTCTNTTFKIRPDGSAWCAHCSEPVNMDVPLVTPSKLKPTDVDRPMTVVQNVSEFAPRRFLRDWKDNIPDIMIGIYNTGRVTTFGNEIATEPQRTWLKRRLADAFSMLTAK